MTYWTDAVKKPEQNQEAKDIVVYGGGRAWSLI
jgi:hypothetical protein